MCLLFAILAVLGPRALVFFWWLLEPARWAATFESAVVPLIGFLFLPWTTIMYVLVFPGGIEGFDWVSRSLANASGAENARGCRVGLPFARTPCPASAMPESRHRPGPPR